VDVLADDCPVRLDDQAHQGRLPVAVLAAARHDAPLAGDLVLGDIATAPCQPPLTGLDSRPTPLAPHIRWMTQDPPESTVPDKLALRPAGRQACYGW
jgi:hypothetical protein